MGISPSFEVRRIEHFFRGQITIKGNKRESMLHKVVFTLTRLPEFFAAATFAQCCCCCCSAYLSSCNRTASDTNLLDDPLTFHYNDYFVIGGIRTCLGVSDDSMFQRISSHSCPLNLLLVRSHQAEIIIVNRFIQGRQNFTRVQFEPRSFD